MATRTVIDSACGVIMAQNRCTHDQAFDLLAKASSHRNQKLHDVATEIISHLGVNTNNSVRFDDCIRVLPLSYSNADKEDSVKQMLVSPHRTVRHWSGLATAWRGAGTGRPSPC